MTLCVSCQNKFGMTSFAPKLWMIMKLTIVLVLFFAFQVQAKEGDAQKITIVKDQISLTQVFKSIEKQTGYLFFYDKALLKQTPLVDIAVRSATLEQTMHASLKGQKLSWTLVGKTVVIRANMHVPSSIISPEMVSVNISSTLPPVEITGRVTDQQGNPLANVSVIISGTTTGTTTNENGNYTITTTDNKGVVLEFSSVGYVSQRITVRNELVVNVQLEVADSGLDEVVVVGYGTVKKKDLTGSIAQIKSEDLNSFPTGNILQAVTGRSTGVQVIQNDGTPGATPSIRIRGTGSILGSNEPLYVIDGFPGSLVDISPSDVESMEILKDASATAIYGSRGSNGVVIVTTKIGKKGRSEVSYDGSFGYQSSTKKMNLMNGFEWADFYNQVAVNDGGSPRFNDLQLDSIKSLPEIDWQKLILKNTPVTNHSLSISGGNDKTIFSISGSVFLQDGIIKNSTFNRYSVHLNLRHEIGKLLNFSITALLSKSNSIRKQTTGTRGNGIIGGMLGASPIISPYNADGTIKRINTVYPWLSNVLTNPLVFTNEQKSQTARNSQMINASLDIKPLDGLIIKLSGGVQNNDSWINAFNKVDPINSLAGSAEISPSRSLSLLNENTINYSRKLGDHNISILGGFSSQNLVSTNLTTSASGFLSNVVETFNMQGAASQGVVSSSYSKWFLLSYFGRFNWDYKGKYFTTVSYRRDGSSMFSSINKWSNFPSAAIAWRVSEENFMKSIPSISNLKIRGSFGSTGNNALNPYQTLNMLHSGQVIFNDALFTSYGTGTIKPGGLKWETTIEGDLGLDIGILRNRLNLTIDYYHRLTKDLLNTVQLPTSTGYVNTVQNIGKIRNKGWEFGIDSRILEQDVIWDLSGNISFNRNTVIRLYEKQDLFGEVFNTGPLTDFINVLRVGEPFAVFLGYVEDGYTENGNIKYKDFNNDGSINSSDKVVIGNPNPKFIYSLSSSVSYKDFNFKLFLQGVQGNDIFNLDANTNIDLGFGLNLPRDVYYNHWTKEAQNAKWPVPSSKLTGNVSDRWVENGSYLRLKNIELSYSLPLNDMKWARKIQIYLSAQNILTFTKFSWFDPEVNSLGSGNSMNQGINYFGYPTAKTYTLGVRSNF